MATDETVKQQPSQQTTPDYMRKLLEAQKGAQTQVDAALKQMSEVLTRLNLKNTGNGNRKEGNNNKVADAHNKRATVAKPIPASVTTSPSLTMDNPSPLSPTKKIPRPARTTPASTVPPWVKSLMKSNNKIMNAHRKQMDRLINALTDSQTNTKQRRPKATSEESLLSNQPAEAASITSKEAQFNSRVNQIDDILCKISVEIEIARTPRFDAVLSQIKCQIEIAKLPSSHLSSRPCIVPSSQFLASETVTSHIGKVSVKQWDRPSPLSVGLFAKGLKMGNSKSKGFEYLFDELWAKLCLLGFIT